MARGVPVIRSKADHLQRRTEYPRFNPRHERDRDTNVSGSSSSAITIVSQVGLVFLQLIQENIIARRYIDLGSFANICRDILINISQREIQILLFELRRLFAFATLPATCRLQDNIIIRKHPFLRSAISISWPVYKIYAGEFV